MTTKKKFFLFIAFVFLTLSFYSNFFHLVPQEGFEKFDAFDEGFVYGRIMNAENKGFFSDAAFTGLLYDTVRINAVAKYNPDSAFSLIIDGMLDQKKMYFGEMEQEPYFGPYYTQPGTMASVYSLINLIFPFTPHTKSHIYDLINAFFNAFVFMILFWWILKEYNIIPAIVTLCLMLISPWVINFCGNVWWIAGSFYLPIFGMFYLLSKKMQEKKILIWLFIFFAVKGLLTGFEFISCTFLSVFVPIVYYYYYHKKSFKEFFIFSLKAGIVCCLSMLIVTFILVLQHKTYYGSWYAGIEWLYDAFLRRTSNKAESYNIWEEWGYVYGLYYWYRDAFDISAFTSRFTIPFAIIIGIVILNLILLYRLIKSKVDNRRYKALILSTALSYIPTVSWFTIFRNHSIDHPHIDSICWYFPFLILGFVCLGMTINIIYERYTER